ncbi:interferon regulatory factor 3-like isoform X2 [Uloborus diversus]|nr:interferon regulatory factor 3-like isoform X2 [Uloborus diversus]XP_054714399.1 interferon regulatory factor 3-like isoform X2 [Uloborus diversus]
MRISNRARLLNDFLIPHLDHGTFGDKLMWINRCEGLFRIFWRHQSSSKFSPEDSIVFKEWALLKGLWDPYDDSNLTKAKQRLRAALLKLKTVKCVDKDNEFRLYQIISGAAIPHRSPTQLFPEEDELESIINFILKDSTSYEFFNTF